MKNNETFNYNGNSFRVIRKPGPQTGQRITHEGPVLPEDLIEFANSKEEGIKLMRHILSKKYGITFYETGDHASQLPQIDNATLATVVSEPFREKARFALDTMSEFLNGQSITDNFESHAKRRTWRSRSLKNHGPKFKRYFTEVYEKGNQLRGNNQTPVLGWWQMLGKFIQASGNLELSKPILSTYREIKDKIDGFSIVDKNGNRTIFLPSYQEMDLKEKLELVKSIRNGVIDVFTHIYLHGIAKTQIIDQAEQQIIFDPKNINADDITVESKEELS